MNFDEAAKKWDMDRKKVERARNVGAEILKYLPDTKNMIAVEYGCGTGLLGFGLLPKFKEMTFSDTSQGMLEVVRGKIEKEGHKNCRIQQIDLENPEGTPSQYDCILNLMLLHHIGDTGKAIGEWSQRLTEGGYLCIADLVKEDGSFHKGSFDGHHGFDPGMLGKLLEEKGLSVKSITTPHAVVRDGREYPLFLIVARKG